MQEQTYQILSHLDAPLRVLGLTIDELVLVGSSFLLVMLTEQKSLVAILGVVLFSLLRLLKKGGGPKVLLRISYWHLPSAFTQFFLPKLPASYQRMWR